LKGFSVQGRIEKARRNYTQMWEQIGSYRKKEGAEALSNFRLNILGEVVEYFAVPGECQLHPDAYKVCQCFAAGFWATPGGGGHS
jgi:hypothetical protein